MNYEFLDNAVKAKKYGIAAIKSLVPEDVKKHFNVIETEMTDLAIDYLQKHKRKCGPSRKEEKSTQGNIKKVTIE